MREILQRHSLRQRCASFKPCSPDCCNVALQELMWPDGWTGGIVAINYYYHPISPP